MLCDVLSGQVFSLATSIFLLFLPADSVKPSVPELPQAVPQYSNDLIRKDLPDYLRVC